MSLERLDKIIASQGFGSRKEAQSLIKSGKVQVNGQAVRLPDFKADAQADSITVGGAPLAYKQFVYIMMNKPAGVVSASRDPKMKTVVDLVPEALYRRGLFPAGRLDRDTTGLLILTDDGDFAHRMLAPKKHVYKLYQATIDGPVGETEIRRFAEGVEFEDGTLCLPAALTVLLPGERPTVEVSIREGKFHQVKKMFRAVGRTVLALERVRIGALSLDPALAPGQSREMTPDETKQVFL